jgi:hypothetical protein
MDELKETIKILLENRIKIIPLKEIKDGKNNKTDYGNNLQQFWNDLNNNIEYSENRIFKQIEDGVIGFGIPTGYYNNLIVIDIDNKEPSNKNISNKLIDDLHKLNTLTIKTPNGFHFYLKYNENLKKNRKGILNHIDIRGNRGLVFNGIRNDGSYTIYKKETIKKLTDDIIYRILDNIPIETNNDKNLKGTKRKEEKYKYDLTDNDLYELLKILPDEYYNDFKKWYRITGILERLNKIDIWDKWSSQSKFYNRKNNLNIWKEVNSKDFYENNLNALLFLIKYHSPNKKIKPIEKVFGEYNELSNDYYERALKINIRHLDVSIFSDSSKLFIIKSNTNTGKTTLTINYMNEINKYGIYKKRVISITHLKSIADDHYKRFENIIYYENIKGIIDNEILEDYNGITICINSILKLELTEIELDNYIIYLDEATAIIETLLSSTTIKNRNEIIGKFIYLLKNSKCIIATDATITNELIEFLETIIGTSQIIINEYKNYTNYDAYFIYDYEKIKTLILEDIKNNNRFMICGNSKSRIIDIFTLVERIKKEYSLEFQNNTKLYTSTDGDTIKNINEEWFNQDILFSPRIVQGVDFNPTTKYNVYSFVVGNGTINPIQVSQQIARCRNPLNTYINIEGCKNKSVFYGDVEKIKSYYKKIDTTYNNLNKKIIDLYNNDNSLIYNSLLNTITTNKGIIKTDNFISNLFYKYRANEDILRSSFIYHLKKILEKKGYRINDELLTEIIKIDRKEQIKETKLNNECKMDKQIKLFNDWINGKLDKTNKTNETYNKRIELLNLDIEKDKEIIIENFKLITEDKTFKQFITIGFYLCKNSQNVNKTLSQNKVLNPIFSIHKNDDNLIKSYKELLIKYYPEINPYYFSYNEFDYINKPSKITEEEYFNIKCLTDTNKTQPNNQIEDLKLLTLLAKRIYGENIIHTFQTTKTYKIISNDDKKRLHTNIIIFDYNSFHKKLKLVENYIKVHTCPYLLEYFKTDDYKNYIITNNNDDDKSVSSTKSIKSVDIPLSPYNVDIEILKNNVLSLEYL